MSAPDPPHDYLKFYVTEKDDLSIARVYAGETQEVAIYSGTLVLETVLFERLMDALAYGARDVYHGDFEVYAGPDDRDVV